jgi:uncharacterized protein YbjT (DUF2867 family)
MDQNDVEEPVENGLLAGRRRGQLAREHPDGIVQRVIVHVGQMQYRRQGFNQSAADVTGKLIRPAEKDGGGRIADQLVARGVLLAELLGGQAGGGGVVGDAVVSSTTNQRHIARGELECGSRVVEPEPGVASDDCVDRQLDGAGQAQAPWRSGYRPGEDATRRPCPGEMLLQHIHGMSVSHIDLGFIRIDPLAGLRDHELMTNVNRTTLVLGGTGKTGTRVATLLTGRGLSVRTAARHAADVAFDWDDPTTHRPAVDGIDRLYLVAPVMRTRFAEQVSAFLDLAEAAGVGHVTYLSAYGIELAPPEVALRAVELDLMARSTLTHSIVRPAWFMQNFSETFLRPIDGAITVPTGDGGEAFVDVEDIAAVAAATLAEPAAHAGAQYAPTGPDTLTVGDAAAIIGRVTGQPIRHVNIDRQAWVDGVIAAGVPAEYGEMLQMLTDTVASDHGSRPNHDVQTVTGTPPTSFADFAQRTAAAWAGNRSQ